MSGFKDFSDGSVLTAAELDGYLMRQSVMRFPTTSDLVANLPSGIREVGMMAHAADTGYVYMWDGTNWVPWMSPELDASVAFTGGGVQVTVSNATVVSKYRLIGGYVHWTYSFTVGSTSNMRTGNYALGLPPIAIHADHANGVIGQLAIYDASAAVTYTRSVVNISNTTNCAAVSEAGVRWSNTNPIGFAVDDQININVRYRASTGVLL
jgi:hypothetical protein